MATFRNYAIFALIVLTLHNFRKYEVHCDLLSTILSQTSHLPAKLIPELKKIISPELLHKMFQSMNQNGSISPSSLESLRKDPVQIQRLLSKLKPMQSRIDPQLFEVLANTFKLTPPPPAASHHPPGKVARVTTQGQANVQHVPRPSPSMVPPPPFQSPIPKPYPITGQANRNTPTVKAATSQRLPSVPPSAEPPLQQPHETTPFTPKLTSGHANNYQELANSAKISRHDPNKFSSTFVRRRNGKPAKLPALTSTPVPITSSSEQVLVPSTTTGAPPPFNHITDPNIKNHRLYQPEYNHNRNHTRKMTKTKEKLKEIEKRFQNYTIIDQLEDLMMDESIPHEQAAPEINQISIVSLVSSEEKSEDVGDWVPKEMSADGSGTVKKSNATVTVTATDEDDDDDVHQHQRAPLLYRNENPVMIAQDHQDRNHNPEDILHTNQFHPSPEFDESLPASPEFFTPGQDFFTSTIRASKEAQSGERDALHSVPVAVPGGVRRKQQFVMPQFPSKNKRKINDHTDTVKSAQEKLNYDQNFLNQFIHRNGVSPTHAHTQPNPALPPHQIIMVPQYGHNSHPFAAPQQPPALHNPHLPQVPNYLSKNQQQWTNSNSNMEQLAENILAQSSANDKVDSGTGWTSTFFLLGGLVAASALVAFILPSFLTTVTTAGKDNDLNHHGGNNGNGDFWNEIKGLYNDLRHIAKGDFTYFQQSDVDSDGTSNELRLKTTSTTRKTVQINDEDAEDNDNGNSNGIDASLEKSVTHSQSPSHETMDNASPIMATTEWTVILNEREQATEAAHDESSSSEETQNQLNFNDDEESSTSLSDQGLDDVTEETETGNYNSDNGKNDDSMRDNLVRRGERRRVGVGYNAVDDDDQQQQLQPLINSTHATFFINNTEFTSHRPMYASNNTFLKEWARVNLKLLEY